MKVRLRNPRRELDVAGPKRVDALLAELGVNRESVLVIRGDTLVTGDALLDRLEINRESVLVIRGDTLVPGDALLEDADQVEIRPVISGGSEATA